ncbi:DOMON domain protein (macronuclear) [Tetrahymena thermophila SB210]|uniref:DOMON domain protein n=1 Tax=Tetrahymena thermophila (strain SB210) TaxID=312017 RepID=I7MN24_TETTS|nr:DOMON domain protein [Tetrahymena thermophila SB210]EAS07769.1 DOMON domain protein [Tetrahymena thermophila SB210]|eukprot:XP_001028011.1 DOMON domain protein [Tetrahymena thermophila SB210]
MKLIILFSLLAACTLAQVTNKISLSNGFVLNYSITSPKISFTLTGSNKGYVALGFGGRGMDGIDVAAFKWDGTQVVGEDRTNIDSQNVVDLDVNKGCVNNLTVDPTSTYDSSTGNWNIKFSRPLNTNEPNCDQIIQAETSQNLAFAIFKDFTWKQHTSQNSWKFTLSASAQNDPNVSSLLIQYSYLTLFFMLMIFV